MSTIGWIGFFSGFTSAAITAAAAFSVYSIIGIRPEPVHAQAMEILNKDRRVISALGPISYGYFRAGKVKAYMIYQGHFALGDGSRGYVHTWTIRGHGYRCLICGHGCVSRCLI